MLQALPPRVLLQEINDAAVVDLVACTCTCDDSACVCVCVCVCVCEAQHCRSLITWHMTQTALYQNNVTQRVSWATHRYLPVTRTPSTSAMDANPPSCCWNSDVCDFSGVKTSREPVLMRNVREKVLDLDLAVSVVCPRWFEVRRSASHGTFCK